MARSVTYILIGFLAVGMMFPGAGPAADDLPFWWPRTLQAATAHGYGLITWPELHTLMEARTDLVILDVRTDYEYRENHIPGALNLEFNRGDLWEMNPEKAGRLKQVLGPQKNRLVVIYCRSYRCIRSEIASTWAVRLGYENVRQFPWGFQGYEEIVGQKDNAVQARRGLKLGDLFPDINLVILGGETDRVYLNLPPETKQVSVKNIPAEYLLLTLYDDLSAQRLQPLDQLNALSKSIQNDSHAYQRLKMIGLGVGGLKRLVAKYAKTNQVAFPLFADDGFWIYNALNQPELPVNYLLEHQKNGDYRIIDKWNEWKDGVAEKYECIRAQMGEGLD